MGLTDNKSFTYGLLEGEIRDFSPAVYMLDNINSPFFSFLLNAGNTERATSTSFTWRTEEYGTKDSSGQVEGGGWVEDYGDRNSHTNYIEIFRKQAKVSGTLNALSVDGIGNELQHQIQMRLIEMKKDIDNALINGAKSVGTTTTGAKMDGIINLIHADNVITKKEFGVDALQETFRKMSDSGFGGNKLLLVNSATMASINLGARKDGTVNLENGQVVYGIDTTKLISTFGTGTFMIDPHVPNDTILFLDVNYITLKHIRAFEGKTLPIAEDSYGQGLVAEFSLKNASPKASAVLKLDTTP